MLPNNGMINPTEIKKKSEEIILNAGGQILDGLPIIEITEPRTQFEVANRALVLNAMFQLHLNAPKFYIEKWIDKNGLSNELSPMESSILNSSMNKLTQEEDGYLYWSLEALWALVWAMNLIEDLPFNKPVGNELAHLSPNIQLNETGSKYLDNMRLRHLCSLYDMRDLYYRLHWWVNNASKLGESTGDVNFDIILERRKALEWILNRTYQWDNVNLNC